jgi:hypothetical protein
MRRFPGSFWLVLLVAGPMLLGSLLVGGCNEKELTKPEPVMDVSPTALQFGEVETGTAAPLSFTIRNSGEGVLRGTVSEACDRFEITAGAGDYSLASGQTKVVTVQFQTAETGDFSCVVSLGGGFQGVPCAARGIHTDVPPPPVGDIFPPAGVLDLRVIAVGVDNVTLRWTAMGDDDVTGRAALYDMRFSINPLSVYDRATVVAGFLPAPNFAGYVETFVVTGLTPNTIYYFWLRSADEVPNWSEVSNRATGTTLPPPPAPPGAITDLAAIEVGQHDLTLTWTAPTGAFNAQYDIRMGTEESTAWADMVALKGLNDSPFPGAPGSGETFNVADLQPGTTYYFRIQTLDTTNNLESPISNRAIATTQPPDPPPDPPGAITDLYGQGLSPTSVLLTWTAPSGDYNDQYDIRMGTEESTAWEEMVALKDLDDSPYPSHWGWGQSFQADGLQPNTTYYFRIRTLDTTHGLESQNSNRVMITTQLNPPGTITDLDYTDLEYHANLGSYSLALIWSAPVGDYNHRYDIRMGTEEASAWEEMVPLKRLEDPPYPNGAGIPEAFSVSDLQPGTNYYFRIRTLDLNHGLVSESSNRLIVTTPPGAITDLAVMPLSPNLLVPQISIRLTWTAPSGAYNTGYQIRWWWSDGDNGWEDAEVLKDWDVAPFPLAPGTPQYFDVIGLDPTKIYHFLIRTNDSTHGLSGQESVDSNEATFPLPPGAITDLEATKVTETSLELHWTAPSGLFNDQYEIRGSADVRATWDDMETIKAWDDPPFPLPPGTPQSFPVFGLQSTTTYHFLIRTRDSMHFLDSQDSNEAIATTGGGE